MGRRESRSFQGQVVGPAPTGSNYVRVNLEGDATPPAGSRVELRVLMSDEEIGRRLRIMLTTDSIGKSAARGLAREVEETCGWPVLAQLISDVVDGA